MAETSHPFSIRAMAEALRRRFGAQGADQQAQAARDASEEASKALPSLVMPRSAIEEQRRRQRAAWDASKDQ